MAKPSVVIFDLGKVLVDFDYTKAGRNLAALSNTSAEKVRQLIDHSPLLFRYETGQISTEQFYGEVRRATGFRGTIADFAAAFADIFKPMHEMIALHAEVRQRRIPAFVLSNTNEMAVRHIRKHYPFFAEFDGYILSHEAGAMKPDARIYEAMERLTGKHSAELLFIDDRADNIEAAAARGWRCVHHLTHQRTRQTMQDLGLL